MRLLRDRVLRGGRSLIRPEHPAFHLLIGQLLPARVAVAPNMVAHRMRAVHRAQRREFLGVGRAEQAVTQHDVLGPIGLLAHALGLVHVAER